MIVVLVEIEAMKEAGKIEVAVAIMVACFMVINMESQSE